MPDPEIIDNTGLHRFELRVEGDTALLIYSKTGSLLRLIHTEVPGALRGKGVGSKLVGGVLQLARRDNLSIVPSCPFVIDYLKRHPEYTSIVDPSHQWLIANE